VTAMPVVFRFEKFTFFFYSNEGDPREPVHIHVRAAGGEAKVWLEPTIGIAESRGFNARELSAIIRKVIDNRTIIQRKWDEHFGN